MNVDVLWTNFLTQVKDELSSLAYDTWFKDTSLYKLDNGKAIIIVPMQIHKKHLADKYSTLIVDKLNNITGTNFELDFILNDEIKETIPAIVEDGYIVFEASHLSEYGVVATEKILNNTVNPKTGDNIIIYAIMFTMSIISIITLSLINRKKCLKTSC